MMKTWLSAMAADAAHRSVQARNAEIARIYHRKEEEEFPPIDRPKTLRMINHDRLPALDGRNQAIRRPLTGPPSWPMVVSCTVSSPFAAFAARLRASDSLAEAVFSQQRCLYARPQGTGYPWNCAFTIR